MPCHIVQSKAQLAYKCISAVEIAALNDLIDQCIRHLFTGLEMHCNLTEPFLFFGPVLHDLGRQLHKVAVYVRSRQAPVTAVTQNAVHGVAKFMQESPQLIIGQHGRHCTGRLGEVEYQRNMGPCITGICFMLFQVIGHPGATLFAFARKIVEVK